MQQRIKEREIANTQFNLSVGSIQKDDHPYTVLTLDEEDDLVTLEVDMDNLLDK